MAQKTQTQTPGTQARPQQGQREGNQGAQGQTNQSGQNQARNQGGPQNQNQGAQRSQNNQDDNGRREPQNDANGKARVGDTPGDLRGEEAAEVKPTSTDRGRDRSPGDLQRSRKDQHDVTGTGFDESSTELDNGAGDPDFTDQTDTDEDETESSSGTMGGNPNPTTR